MSYRNWHGANYRTYRQDGRNVPYFYLPLDDSGVVNLPLDLTINGSTVSPTFRYHGIDAGVTSWPAVAGEDLTIADSGTAPETNQDTPLLGANDAAVNFKGGKVYASATAFADIALEDFWIEGIVRVPGGGAYVYASTRSSAGGAGWSIVTNNSIHLLTNDAGGGNDWAPAIDPIDTGCWHYFAVAVDRDENNATTGSRMSVNGDAYSATANKYADRTTLSQGNALTIGSYANYNSKMVNGGMIAYLAMYKKTDWFAGGAQNTTDWQSASKERFARLTSLYALTRGTSVPSVRTRATIATMERVVSSGTRKIFTVGDGWMRCASMTDTGGTEQKGMLSEIAATNLCKESQTFNSATWVKGTGATVTANTIASPDGMSTADSLDEDDQPGSHRTRQPIAMTSGTKYIWSIYAKKANRNWLQLLVDQTTDAKCSFDLDAGAVGTATNCVGAMESVGGGWYRCWIAWTCDDTGDIDLNVYIAEADDDTTFDGADQVSLYVWGSQTEVNTMGRPSSYVVTTSAAVTRDKDQLYYSGDCIPQSGDIGCGVVECKYVAPNHDRATVGGVMVNVNDGGASADAIELGFSASDVATFTTAAAGGSGGSVTGTTDIIDGDQHTLRGAFQPSSDRLIVDGTSEGTEDTSADQPDDLDRIAVGMDESAATQPGGLISQVRLYPRRKI